MRKREKEREREKDVSRAISAVCVFVVNLGGMGGRDISGRYTGRTRSRGREKLSGK